MSEKLRLANLSALRVANTPKAAICILASVVAVANQQAFHAWQEDYHSSTVGRLE